MAGDYFNRAALANDDNAATLVARLRLNNIVNQMVDDDAVLITGLSVGTVVKYDSTDNRWEACDGTVELETTDVIGIVSYIDGTDDTSGQVKVGGVYVDDSLSADTDYYCQSTGALGTDSQKVYIGHCCKAGQLVLKINGGSSGGGSSASLSAFSIDSRDSNGEPSQITIGTTVYTITRNGSGRLDTLSDGDTTLTMTYDDIGNLSGATAA